MAWGYEGLVGASADGVLTKTRVAERFIGGIGIPFVDGANRPVLSLRPAVAFEGFVDIMPDDSQFYIYFSIIRDVSFLTRAYFW